MYIYTCIHIFVVVLGVLFLCVCFVFNRLLYVFVSFLFVCRLWTYMWARPIRGAPNRPTKMIPTKILLTHNFWDVLYGHYNSTPCIYICIDL